MNTIETENNTELYDKLIIHFEKQLDRSNYWVSFAEAKNGAIIAINVALMAVLISIFDKSPIFCVISISCFLVSCVYSLYSFIPNTNSVPDRNIALSDGNLNLLFFGDIAKIETTEKYIELSIKKYFSDRDIPFNALVYDLAREVFINSQIAFKKCRDFKQAVKIDFFAIFVSIIFLCIA